MHKRISINALCFKHPPFAELAGHLRALNASRVSLISPSIDTEGVVAAQTTLANFQIEAICHPFLPHGAPVDPRPETWTASRDRFNRTIDTAKAVGARSIFTVSGGHGTLTWEEAAAVFRDAIAPCVAYAKSVSLPLMIENLPQLHGHSHIAHSLHDNLLLAEMADIGLCIDFFGCWSEAGLKQTIRRAVPRCHLVQVTDYVSGDLSLPARAVPGDGDIPVKRLIDWLLEAGYTGIFDLELVGPRIDKEGHLAATRRAADTLGEILNALGA